ncbi:MAG: DUF4465 domain-containing protein [Bacteroidota bacterium]
MKKFLLISCIAFIFSNLQAQEVVADFENFDLPQDTFLNGSDLSGGFISGDVFLPNAYNADFNSWSGWAISTKRDTVTPGLMNQFSSVTGTGFESDTYAVSAAFGPTDMNLQGESVRQPIKELYITNSTYAYRSMLEGDAFAKKFGGVDGTDPDFFVLTIKAFRDGEVLQDSIDFYLADYRFDDPADDYIVTEWTRIDVSQFGAVDGLRFTLNSSDVGNYGMNTPAYFCVDQVVTNARPTFTNQVFSTPIQVFPNPTTDRIQFDWTAANGLARVFDQQGRLVKAINLQHGTNTMAVQELPKGTYFLQLQDEQQLWRSTFVKK